jgi:hypothetical protein
MAAGFRVVLHNFIHPLDLLLLGQDECLASGGHNSQSASGIPAGGALITGGLCLKCKLESSWRQGFCRADVLGEPSRILNAYGKLKNDGMGDSGQ